MDKVSVVFWSASGNTEAMANAVVEGAKKAGKDAEAIFVSDANVAALRDLPGFALGCPAMGAEVLEEDEFEPFMESLEGSCGGKTVALFGSYGWGDGTWMRDWEDRMKAAGATLVNGEGVIANGAPDDDAVAQCQALGAALAAL